MSIESTLAIPFYAYGDNQAACEAFAELRKAADTIKSLESRLHDAEKALREIGEAPCDVEICNCKVEIARTAFPVAVVVERQTPIRSEPAEIARIVSCMLMPCVECGAMVEPPFKAQPNDRVICGACVERLRVKE